MYALVSGLSSEAVTWRPDMAVQQQQPEPEPEPERVMSDPAEIRRWFAMNG